MEIAPIDSQVISGASEHTLLLRSQVQHGERTGAGTTPDYGLVGSIDGDPRIDIQQDCNFVALSVSRVNVPGEISDRARKYVEMFGKRRSKERQLEFDTGGFEDVDRVCGFYLYRQLPHRGQGIRRIVARALAHIAIRCAIDANQAGKRLFGARPVTGVLICQVVGHRPDTEIGVVGDQRHRRGPYLRGRDRSDCRDPYQDWHPLEQERSSTFHGHAYGLMTVVDGFAILGSPSV